MSSAVTASTPPPAAAAASASANKGKGREKPLASLLAGTTAGAIEGFVTYPTEFAKTRLQFANDQVAKRVVSSDGMGGVGMAEGAVPKRIGPISIIRETIAQKGIRGLYAGCTALVTGNAVKAGVRFLSYDQYKSMLRDEEGKLSAPRSLLAGLGAGMTEAVFAVTPSETIKTKLIEDARRAVPRYNGMIQGTAVIVREEGIGGIYRGLVPVMMRQGANSAVRFSSYSTLKQFVQGSSRPGQQLPSVVTFGIGALAGIITVYTTMPLDVIKTRMQSLEARAQYRNSAHCAYRIFTEEGVARFWKGTTPRLARLIMSGGIVFTVYEAVYPMLDKVF